MDCTGHFPRPPRTQPFTYEEKLIPEIQTTPTIDEDKNDTPDDNGLDEMDETDNKEDCGDDENNNKKEEELNQKNENKNMIED